MVNGPPYAFYTVRTMDLYVIAVSACWSRRNANGLPISVATPSSKDRRYISLQILQGVMVVAVQELEREVRKALEEGDLLGLPSDFEDLMADQARAVANGGSQAGTDNGLGNELGEDSGNEAGYDRKRSQVRP